jgi:hypothetical protein
MKKLFAILFLVASFPLSVYAVYVNGYYRSNGTYVKGHERTAPDGNPYNNYSYPGNYNPNTGSITGGSADAYLNNYYKNSSGGSSYSSSYSVPSTPSCNNSIASFNGISYSNSEFATAFDIPLIGTLIVRNPFVSSVLVQTRTLTTGSNER